MRTEDLVQEKELKLKTEIVPKNLWYLNLRKKLSKKEWDRIRKKSYLDAGYKCAICNIKGKINCHEIWEYNDNDHIQKLNGFTALCDNCHMIKHIGFANLQASRGLLDMNKLIEHFMKVNNVSKDIFEKHYDESFKIWGERNKHEWKQELK